MDRLDALMIKFQFFNCQLLKIRIYISNLRRLLALRAFVLPGVTRFGEMVVVAFFAEDDVAVGALDGGDGYALTNNAFKRFYDVFSLAYFVAI